jgi:ABC-type cobalt transport system substrate-binding protein
MITIKKYDETYAKIICDPGIAMEISDQFTFEIPGAKFMPAFKNKMWDGKIRLFNAMSCLLYVGLIQHLQVFCSARDYDIEYDGIDGDTEFSLVECKEFIEWLKPKYNPRDYQIEAFVHAVRKKRSVLLSPTASGKSLIIYMIACWYKSKTLIIVPTTSLVHQMVSDFEDYGFPENSIHKIMSGADKDSDKMFFVSTWQSIYRMPKEWFDQFNVVIGDECLHPDTNISMSDGSTKKIKNIRAGDTVLTFNEKTQTIEQKPVIKVHHNLSVNEQMFEIQLSNGSSIRITGNHKVLLTTGVWKRADELNVGDLINSIK